MKNGYLKILTGLILLLISGDLTACPVCERNQPAVLKGITHGNGPETQFDYAIIAVAVTIVLLTLYFSVKFLIQPKEHSDSHIKRFILINN